MDDTQTHTQWLQLCVSVVFNTRVSNEANGREYKYRMSHCGVGKPLLNIWQIWAITAAAGSSIYNLSKSKKKNIYISRRLVSRHHMMLEEEVGCWSYQSQIRNWRAQHFEKQTTQQTSSYTRLRSSWGHACCFLVRKNYSVPLGISIRSLL